MQGEKDHLKRALTRSIFFVCFLVFPTVLGLLVLAPILIELIPRYEKWSPALAPLVLISINTIFAASTTQLTNLLNAIGKIKLTFKLMVMWTTLTWILVPFLAMRYSVLGAAAGYALVGGSSVVAIYLTYKVIPFGIYESIGRPFLGTLLMTIALLLLRALFPVSFLSVFVLIALGAILYMIIMYFIVGSTILADAKKGLESIFARG
jgi:O-antigen/teichoic acid export membrane protein